MSRYKTSAGIEGEYEPGSRNRVLRNLLGIRLKSEMDQAEHQAMMKAQTKYYTNNLVTKNTKITTGLIKQMHEDWLGGIYEWAGTYRTVDMIKDGFPFPGAFTVQGNMEKLEETVLSVHTPCSPAPLTQVCRSMAIVHANLLLIHPFREGNGRIARWLADLMAAQADYPPPIYRFTGKGSKAEKRRYFSAVIAGYREDYDFLADFFEECVSLRLDII